MKLSPLGLAAVTLLSACASSASLTAANMTAVNYQALQADCARGEASACAQVPMAYQAAMNAQMQVQNEQNTSAAVGLGVLAVGLGVLDAATCCNYGYHYHYHHWRHW